MLWPLMRSVLLLPTFNRNLNLNFSHSYYKCDILFPPPTLLTHVSYWFQIKSASSHLLPPCFIKSFVSQIFPVPNLTIKMGSSGCTSHPHLRRSIAWEVLAIPLELVDLKSKIL